MEKEREIRLRRQIEELVRSRVSGLEQDISHLQREVNESFTRLLERTDMAASMSDSDQLLTQIAAEVTAQVDQASAESVRLGADIALLRDSVVELDEQRTQAEVLNALVARAANFAPRVVLFVVKGANALAWAARGFDDSMSSTAIRGLSIPLQADTALRAAVNSQQTFYGGPEQQPESALIFDRLGGLQPQRVLAVPLKVRGKVAAVLYADSADRGEDATNVEAVELLVHMAGLVVELVSLRSRMGEAAPRQAEAARPAQPQATQSQSPPQAPAAQAQTPAPTPQPAPVESDQPASSAPAYFRPAAEPPPAVAPAEPPPAAPPVIEAPPPAPPAASAQGSNSGSRSASLEEEEDLHKSARRFARLLVSEIKLYNEQKVSEGRRNNDLYDRLKEDIDRSRQMYEKRVSPVVAAKFDYFYDELVNTLAEGDSSKLGSDHPGPAV